MAANSWKTQYIRCDDVVGAGLGNDEASLVCGHSHQATAAAAASCQGLPRQTPHCPCACWEHDISWGPRGKHADLHTPQHNKAGLGRQSKKQAWLQSREERPSRTVLAYTWVVCNVCR